MTRRCIVRLKSKIKQFIESITSIAPISLATSFTEKSKFLIILIIKIIIIPRNVTGKLKIRKVRWLILIPKWRNIPLFSGIILFRFLIIFFWYHCGDVFSDEYILYCCPLRFSWSVFFFLSGENIFYYCHYHYYYY